jgi:hypothetical protein
VGNEHLSGNTFAFHCATATQTQRPKSAELNISLVSRVGGVLPGARHEASPLPQIAQAQYTAPPSQFSSDLDASGTKQQPDRGAHINES